MEVVLQQDASSSVQAAADVQPLVVNKPPDNALIKDSAANSQLLAEMWSHARPGIDTRPSETVESASARGWQPHCGVVTAPSSWGPSSSTREMDAMRNPGRTLSDGSVKVHDQTVLGMGGIGGQAANVCPSGTSHLPEWPSAPFAVATPTSTACAGAPAAAGLPGNKEPGLLGASPAASRGWPAADGRVGLLGASPSPSTRPRFQWGHSLSAVSGKVEVSPRAQAPAPPVVDPIPRTESKDAHLEALSDSEPEGSHPAPPTKPAPPTSPAPHLVAPAPHPPAHPPFAPWPHGGGNGPQGGVVSSWPQASHGGGNGTQSSWPQAGNGPAPHSSWPQVSAFAGADTALAARSRPSPTLQAWPPPSASAPPKPLVAAPATQPGSVSSGQAESSSGGSAAAATGAPGSQADAQGGAKDTQSVPPKDKVVTPAYKDKATGQSSKDKPATQPSGPKVSSESLLGRIQLVDEEIGQLDGEMVGLQHSSGHGQAQTFTNASREAPLSPTVLAIYQANRVTAARVRVHVALCASGGWTGARVSDSGTDRIPASSGSSGGLAAAPGGASPRSKPDQTGSSVGGGPPALKAEDLLPPFVRPDEGGAPLYARVEDSPRYHANLREHEHFRPRLTEWLRRRATNRRRTEMEVREGGARLRGCAARQRTVDAQSNELMSH